jgi:DNA processing protein
LLDKTSPVNPYLPKLACLIVNENELLDYLQLSFAPHVGPSTVLRLIGEFGDAGKVLSASSKQLRCVYQIGEKTAESIQRSRSQRVQLSDELAYCKKHGVRILPYHNPSYPLLLREIPSPPPVLFCVGNLQALTAPKTLAIVGTRHPTLYGQRVTRRLTSNLSRQGFTIVSGLARGIDRIAHEATLEEYGTTLAVLGSGIKNIYPASHIPLAKQIQQDGLLISEVLPSSPPHSRLFPRRNRIISGLSYGTLVVEAAARSGALITARHAMEQNREVLAIPGMIDTAVASGCNKLIKDGAQLVESLEDIIEALPHHLQSSTHHKNHRNSSNSEQPSPKRSEALSDTERQILTVIPETTTLIDMLQLPEQIPPGKLLSALTMLELKQFISRPASNSVIKIKPTPTG